MPNSKQEQDKINLCGTHTFTDEERRKGGINSAAARKKAKSMNEVVSLINTLNATGKQADDIRAKYGDVFNGEDDFDVNKQTLFAFRVYTAAMSGDTRAMKLWNEMSDQFADRKKSLEIERLAAEVEKLKAEVSRLRMEAEEESDDVIVNIEIKDCKR